MGLRPEHVCGTTVHARRGAVRNAFRYRVDYVMLEPEAEADPRGPRLFSRNRFNFAALHDRDHGGPRGAGAGAAWVRAVLEARGLHALRGARVQLLAQPRILGRVFNPVSFWLVSDEGGLRAVIAEVNNTYGDRHSYLCHHPDLRPIRAEDRLRAEKCFHVSPFQPVDGAYVFRFDIRQDRVGIVIDYRTADGAEGLFATFHGRRRPLTSAGLLAAALARPVGALRVLGLIHWQALKLWAKGAPFRPRPPAPREEVT